jgi:hypothetical protein
MDETSEIDAIISRPPFRKAVYDVISEDLWLTINTHRMTINS